MMGAGGYLRKSDVGTDLLKLDEIGCFLFLFDQLPMFSQKHGLVMVLSTTKL